MNAKKVVMRKRVANLLITVTAMIVVPFMTKNIPRNTRNILTENLHDPVLRITDIPA